VRIASATYICHVIVHVTVAAMKKAAFNKKAYKGGKGEKKFFTIKSTSLLYKKNLEEKLL